MNGLAIFGVLWNTVQVYLFPLMEEEIGELDAKHREFIAVCEACAPHEHMANYRWCGDGCPPRDRLPICKAFIAKAVWDFPTTRDLIDAVKYRPTLRRLCGWETAGSIPSESTFSRAFAGFAKDQLPERIHEAMIKKHLDGKLAGHISRDGTAIHAREKAARKKTKGKTNKETAPRRRGRKPKGQPPAAPPEPTRMQKQLERTLEENLADLPRDCDWGSKRNSQGKGESWRGYKLHIDTMDGDLPVSWLLSSASMHDSQAAIPLAQMTAERVVSLYDLADSAYDAPAIREMSARLGHVAIIDYNPRRGEKMEFTTAEKIRYRERSGAERVNSHLHDSHGGRHVRVRGPVKVAAHLSFGLLVIAAEQLFTMLC